MKLIHNLLYTGVSAEFWFYTKISMSILLTPQEVVIISDFNIIKETVAVCMKQKIPKIYVYREQLRDFKSTRIQINITIKTLFV